LAYRLQTAWGEGNYRLMYFTTTPDFAAAPGEGLDRAEGVVLSLDQELGSGWGAFLRLVWQGDALLGDYSARYTGGLNVLGTAWGRAEDNLGLAVGYLEGPAGDLSPVEGGPMAAPPDEPSLASTWIGEAYYRFVATDWLALSADIQYMNDRYRAGEDVRGWVFGLRATLDY
jgi:porin